ncbi:hypothetical protein GCM10020000_00050 [Streptomyces olivoverticillatus]
MAPGNWPAAAWKMLAPRGRRAGASPGPALVKLSDRTTYLDPDRAEGASTPWSSDPTACPPTACGARALLAGRLPPGRLTLPRRWRDACAVRRNATTATHGPHTPPNGGNAPMNHNDLYISGIASWYPKPVPVDKAIDESLVQARPPPAAPGSCVPSGGDGSSQPEMAVRAGRRRCAMPVMDIDDFALERCVL